MRRPTVFWHFGIVLTSQLPGWIFPIPWKRFFFSSKNFHLQLAKMRMLKGTTWMMKPTTKPAPPLARPARAAFERALQSAKDALKIASPLEVGGILGRGNSLNPRCNEGMGVKWPWIDGWRYGWGLGIQWCYIDIEISSCWVELEKHGQC